MSDVKFNLRYYLRRPLPIAIKVLLAIHIPIIVVVVNYFSPGSRFQVANHVEMQIAQIRKGLTPAPRAPERTLIVAYLENMTQRLNVAAWGSSRSLSISSKAVGTDRFLNVSASFGVLFDLAALYSIFERTGRFPKKLIVSIDGWMFNRNLRSQNWTDYGHDALRGLEFVSMADVFGWETSNLVSYAKRGVDNLFYLLSVPVFRFNFTSAYRSFREGRSLAGPIAAHPIDLKTDRWDRDLSYWYPCKSAEHVRRSAELWGTDDSSVLLGNFVEIDPRREMLLRALLGKLRERSVELFLFLAPIHPVTYAGMSTTPARRLTAQVEILVRAVGRDMSIPVFGSYDPSKVGLTASDFCTDAEHIRPDVMERVFRNSGLDQAVRR